ncbi:sensor histidine kinase [Limosilactobacillus fermentum]|uniref:sensor histidine kinase n=1 Tax=Limosilactobacillus fermentum TaxID=1613 RepID=UPI00301E4605
MKNNQFWRSQFRSALPLLIGYLLFITLIWLLITLYYLSVAFLIDVIRFSLPLLIVWEALDCYRSAKRINALQHEKVIAATNPVEAQLLNVVHSQKRSHQKAIRHLHNQQQMQLDHVELYSHEIKNSLTSLQAAAETSDAVPSQVVIHAVHQANDQLNMLLNDERLAMTNHDFNFEWISISALISDILKQNAPIFIHRQLAPQLINLNNVKILTDRKWLRFCIYQLLTNGIKYSPQGATITIKWRRNCLLIIDHGEGISSSDLPRIYENGFSGHNGHQTTKSTGMGLYLVKKVTTQLNFNLTVSSQISKGTTASLQFPTTNVRLTPSNDEVTN